MADSLDFTEENNFTVETRDRTAQCISARQTDLDECRDRKDKDRDQQEVQRGREMGRTRGREGRERETRLRKLEREAQLITYLAPGIGVSSSRSNT